MCERKKSRELVLNFIAKITLPKSFAIELDNIFVANVRRGKTVATARRSCGGPSEILWGVLGGIFRSCPQTSQKLPLCGNHQTQDILGQLLWSLLQNPQTFSEVAPEVRLRSEKRKSESNRNKIESRKIAIRILQSESHLSMLKATLESHDSKRTTLDSESPIQCP